MRLTKEEFVQKMEQLEAAMNTVDKIEEVTHFSLVDSPLFTIISDFMNFLREMCDIPANYRGDDSLSYYVYELDFGKKYTPGCVTEADGKECPLSNPSELYDDLCKSWGGYKQ